jgi:hypothetical protein
MKDSPIFPSVLSADPSVDHALLIAGAAVNQAATVTAVLATRIAQARRTDRGDALTALVRIFAGQDAGAAQMLLGSFHPRVAHGCADMARSRMMKPGFTLAF